MWVRMSSHFARATASVPCPVDLRRLAGSGGVGVLMCSKSRTSPRSSTFPSRYAFLCVRAQPTPSFVHTERAMSSAWSSDIVVSSQSSTQLSTSTSSAPKQPSSTGATATATVESTALGVLPGIPLIDYDTDMACLHAAGSSASISGGSSSLWIWGGFDDQKDDENENAEDAEDEDEPSVVR
jgi:hypothetical protein